MTKTKLQSIIQDHFIGAGFTQLTESEMWEAARMLREIAGALDVALVQEKAKRGG